MPPSAVEAPRSLASYVLVTPHDVRINFRLSYNIRESVVLDGVCYVERGEWGMLF